MLPDFIGVPLQASLEKAREMLLRFGLEEKKMFQPVENLSRGQQQMVSIARSLLSTPKLLLLDEPTTGLDPKSKRQVQDFVREINGNSGITVILTSHDMEEVEKLCGRIAFIREGRIWAVGSSSELRNKASSDSLEDVFLKLTGEEFEDKAVA
jgi:ABC-2 type transport system ATP-binding protein